MYTLDRVASSLPTHFDRRCVTISSFGSRALIKLGTLPVVEYKPKIASNREVNLAQSSCIEQSEKEGFVREPALKRRTKVASEVDEG